MTSYNVVEVVPDTPGWEQERRSSIGASELAAVLGLSPYATPLDVWKHKNGVDRAFDPLLSFVGHASEPIMHQWVEKYSGVTVKLEPAFMARSIEHPFIHASFDRWSADPFITWQFKTAHQRTDHHWDEGIPTDIRVQVQGEMLVAGTQRAAVVVWIGGREFRLFWEPRDERFIQEHLIPAARDLWERVQSGEPPAPTTFSEFAEMWPTESQPVEASETALEAVERRTVLLSDIQSQEAEADALKKVIAEYMLTAGADTLTYDGQKLLTFKKQKGRTSFDKTALELDHPDIVAAYTRQGADFMVMRRSKPKEKKSE